MPTFVVVNNTNQVMKVLISGIIFVDDARMANTYTSKYQAKRHLKELDNIPEGVKIVELVM